jgi:hypothetical protein
VAVGGVLTSQPRKRCACGSNGFELGAIHIRRRELLSADVVLARSEGIAGRDSADVLHLRAVLCEMRGERAGAQDLYRRTIGASHSALSSVTYVLALRNLAELLLHVNPTEGVALTGLALRSIEAQKLDPRLRPSILNTRSYAMSCLGELEGAAETAAVAQAAAVRFKQPRIHLYATFNGAVAEELQGRLESSAAALMEVGREAAAVGATDIVTWASLRSLWLRLLIEGPAALQGELNRAVPEPVAEPYRRTFTTLSALIALSETPNAAATRVVGELVESYAAEGDDLTAFALLLWLCHAHERSGRRSAARYAVRRAYDLGAPRGFRISPNWWSHAVVLSARSVSDDDKISSYLGALHAVQSGHYASGTRLLNTVIVSRGAELSVGGVSLPDSSWHEGRSGPRMLRRYFDALAEAHPNALTRDRLMDLLWPDSDGASAIQNLYAATHDLRRVVSAVPGLKLVVHDQKYRLRGESNVTFDVSRETHPIAV